MKKFLTILLTVVLTAAVAITGTVAYLTAEDSDVNTMTFGDVKIAQHEFERVVDANGNYTTIDVDGTTSYELKEFTQDKPLYPIVGDPNSGYDPTEVRLAQLGHNSRGGMQVLTPENVQDKFVVVENTGISDAYVRTLVAFEAGEVVEEDWYKLVQYSAHLTWKETQDWFVIEIGGNNYYMVEFVYNGYQDVQHPNGVLKPGDYTYNSLAQVYLYPEATREDCVALDGNGNGKFDILVLSQAVQAKGFADAKTALDTAFGEFKEGNKTEIEKWFLNVLDYTPVSTAAELKAAVENGENVLLEAGEYTTNFSVPAGSDISIVGNGKDTVLSGQIASTSSTEGTITLKNLTIKVDNSIVDSTGISQTGKSAIALWGNQTVICENVTFDMSLANSTAITSWWDTGIGTSIIVRNCTFNCNGQRPIRATGNVTVENCTFNDPYRYAVQLTAKASTATLLDKATINFNNNKIVDGANGKDFVYGIQLEGADYGCNNCVINGAGNTIENGGAGSAMYYCECGKVVHETIEWNVEVPAVHEAP